MYRKLCGLGIISLCLIACYQYYIARNGTDEPRTNLHSDSLENRKSSVCAKLKLRAANLRKICKQEKLELYSEDIDLINYVRWSSSAPWLFYSQSYNLVYCQIPKTGTTNWMRVMAVLNGLLSNVTDNADTSIHTIPMPDNIVNSLDEVGTKNALNADYKFMVVRDPLERLLSAYIDKLEKPHPTFRDLAIDIVNHFSGGKLTRLAPTFDQFLRFVDCEETSGISGHVSLNRHWKNFFKLCLPCDIEYNYILHAENLKKESDCLLREINAPKYLQFPNYPIEINKDDKGQSLPAHGTKGKMFSYFATVDRNVIKNIIGKYKLDIRIYNYTLPWWI